jgi:hypothetical protein
VKRNADGMDTRWFRSTQVHSVCILVLHSKCGQVLLHRWMNKIPASIGRTEPCPWSLRLILRSQ